MLPVITWLRLHGYHSYSNLWMLGNFLKIDLSVICCSNFENLIGFLWGMFVWVTNRFDLRPAAELLAQVTICFSVYIRIMFVDCTFKGSTWPVFNDDLFIIFSWIKLVHHFKFSSYWAETNHLEIYINKSFPRDSKLDYLTVWLKTWCDRL